MPINGKCWRGQGCDRGCPDNRCDIPETETRRFTAATEAFPFGFPPPHFGVSWQDRAARPLDHAEPPNGERLRVFGAGLDEYEKRVVSSLLDKTDAMRRMLCTPVYLVLSCEDDSIVAAYDNAEAAEEHALSDNPDLATGEDLYSQQVTVYSTTEDYIYENANL